MTLPARELASGWLNASLAAGSDSARPQTYRTMLVEVFDEGVQLVASDGAMLLTTPVATISDPGGLNLPSADQVPDESFIVMDLDGRMRNLMRWVLKDAKAAEKEGREAVPVSVEVRSGERSSAPTLSPDLDRKIMVVTTERERLDLELYEGVFLAWRPLFAGHVAKPTETVAFAPTLLARLGRLRDVENAVEFQLGGPDGGAKFGIDCDPPIEGLLMPVRVVPPVKTSGATLPEVGP
jgi:hypothetical protein